LDQLGPLGPNPARNPDCPRQRKRRVRIRASARSTGPVADGCWAARCRHPPAGRIPVIKTHAVRASLPDAHLREENPFSLRAPRSHRGQAPRGSGDPEGWQDDWQGPSRAASEALARPRTAGKAPARLRVRRRLNKITAESEFKQPTRCFQGFQPSPHYP